MSTPRIPRRAATQFEATKKLLLDHSPATEIELTMSVGEGLPKIFNAIAWHHDLALDVAAGCDALSAVARLGIHLLCGQSCMLCDRPKVLFDCLSPVSTPPDVPRPVDATICGLVWEPAQGIYARDCENGR